MSEDKPIPYPADTLAKGWRFELDHERIEQSDTWALAPAELKPWLLMLWMMSWRQTPCGTLPDDDAVIAARIGMPAKVFTKHRTVLMRGWWRATDGRLYHDTITVRVKAMLDKRANDAQRAASRRARKSESPPGTPDEPVTPTVIPPGVTPASRVTPPGVPPEFDTKHQAVKLIPRTDTQPGVSVDNFPAPTPYGAAFGLLHRLGVVGADPADPVFKAVVDKGVADDEWRAAAAKAAARGRTDLPYVIGIVEKQRKDAAALAAGMGDKAAQVGPVVPPAESSEQYLQRMAVERAAEQRTPEQIAAASAAVQAVRQRHGLRKREALLPADGEH